MTPRAQVLEAADVVDDGEGRDVVEQRVEREVAAERVLLGRAERVVAVDEVIVLAVPRLAALRRAVAPALRVGLGLRLRLGFRRLLLGDLPPERGDLDDLRAELDVRQAEAAADDPAVPEQLLDLVRMRGGADVEVLRPASRAADRGRCRRRGRR